MGLCCSSAVNFQTANGDIAFHFNPRQNEKVVVRNTYAGGHWQQDEREQDSFPFTAGQPFTVKITVESDQYAVTQMLITM